MVLASWVVFSAGLVLAFNADSRVLVWLVPSVIGTFLLQQGGTYVAGSVLGTPAAGAALRAFANILDADPRRPPADAFGVAVAPDSGRHYAPVPGVDWIVAYRLADKMIRYRPHL